MKKFLAIFVCLIIVLSLACCTKNGTENTDNPPSDSHQDDVSSEPEIPSVPTVQDQSYKNIVCTKVTELKEFRFTGADGKTVVLINMPFNWTLQKSDNGYNIIKNSQVIGNVTSLIGSNYTDQTVNVYHREVSPKGVKIIHNIDRNGTEAEPSFTRTLCYNYDESRIAKSIVLTFNYKEVDSVAVNKMMARAKKTHAPQSNMGILKLTDKKKKILILGNSFVASSNIGDILSTMCGSKASVEAQSVGMATVSTFVKDGHSLQKIRSGNYSILFMCGFYADNNSADFEKIVEACKDSNTKLAIFPAHNENRNEIDRSAAAYSHATLIDWKAEVDALIACGVDWTNLYVDDEANHSTPLAGYVGAHMIYRAVFDEIPKTTTVPEVTKSEIELLGNYSKTGKVDFLNFKGVYVVK